LRKPLGKTFYDKKKYPFPIDCENSPDYSGCSDYEAYLNSLSGSTYFVQGNGPNYTLKVARITMKEEDILENVLSTVKKVVAHMIHSGDLEVQDVRRVCLKTFNSPSLPIFSYLSADEKKKLPTALNLLKKEKTN